MPQLLVVMVHGAMILWDKMPMETLGCILTILARISRVIIVAIVAVMWPPHLIVPEPGTVLLGVMYIVLPAVVILVVALGGMLVRVEPVYLNHLAHLLPIPQLQHRLP